MPDPRLPTEAELEKLMNEGRNWGRWGENGAKGTMNLVTPEKVVQAASLVKKGRQVSLSQVFPTIAGPDNERPALHYTYTIDRGLRGEACDFYGTDYHTVSTTHVDALNHLWDVEGGGWDGADPDKMITTRGATSGGIEAWSDGIVTRGVFLNVPKYRGVPCVTPDNPVLNWELDDIVDQLGIEVGAGDAVVIYSGRGGRRRLHNGGQPGPGSARRATSSSASATSPSSLGTCTTPSPTSTAPATTRRTPPSTPSASCSSIAACSNPSPRSARRRAATSSCSPRPRSTSWEGPALP